MKTVLTQTVHQKSQKNSPIGVQYAHSQAKTQSKISRRQILQTGILVSSAFMVEWGMGINALLAAPAPPYSFEAQVTAVEAANIFLLADGRRVILPNILPPGPDRLEPMSDTRPVRRAAQAAADIVLGKEIRVDPLDPGLDRYGRVRGRVLLGQLDVAIQLAKDGWVRVFPEPDALEADVAPLLLVEQDAEGDRIGFWEDGLFRYHSADAYSDGLDRFQILEGVVQRVSRIGGFHHLEFGADWRNDVTARVARRLSETAEISEGRRVRIRGYLRSWNGPFMEIEHPLQIALL